MEKEKRKRLKKHWKMYLESKEEKFGRYTCRRKGRK